MVGRLPLRARCRRGRGEVRKMIFTRICQNKHSALFQNASVFIHCKGRKYANHHIGKIVWKGNIVHARHGALGGFVAFGANFHRAFGYVKSNVDVLWIVALAYYRRKIKARAATCVHYRYRAVESEMNLVCNLLRQRKIKTAIKKIAARSHHVGIVPRRVGFWRKKIKIAFFCTIKKMSVFAYGIATLLEKRRFAFGT